MLVGAPVTFSPQRALGAGTNKLITATRGRTTLAVAMLRRPILRSWGMGERVTNVFPPVRVRCVLRKVKIGVSASFF